MNVAFKPPAQPPKTDTRVTWPPLAMSAACFGLCVYLVATTTWPLLAGAALIAAVFCAVSPRMKGPFGLKTGADASLGGEFADPFVKGPGYAGCA